MNSSTPRHAASLVLAALLLGSAAPAPAQEPEKEDLPTFAVTTSNAAGEEMTVFPARSTVYYDIRFTLALSASERYATRVTLIRDADGVIAEEELYQGVLREGHYRFRVPAQQPLDARGEVRYKVVFRTRFFPKKFTGESFLIYRSVEGTYGFERRKPDR